MLNPSSPVPLYHQLADILSEQIRRGDFVVGSKIPSEHVLASEYGLGRPTVRQATEILVRKNVLERRRGSGTFVSDKPEVDLFSLGGTLASFNSSGFNLEIKWTKRLALRKVVGDSDNPFVGQRVFTGERLGLVKSKPVLLEKLFFDQNVFPSLASMNSEAKSLSRYIAHRYKLAPTGGRQNFRVCRVDQLLGKVFSRQEGTPLMLVKRLLDFPGAAGAIFVALYCDTNEWVFSQEIGGV